jgi:hypothetical protein
MYVRLYVVLHKHPHMHTNTPIHAYIHIHTYTHSHNRPQAGLQTASSDTQTHTHIHTHFKRIIVKICQPVPRATRQENPNKQKRTNIHAHSLPHKHTPIAESCRISSHFMPTAHANRHSPRDRPTSRAQPRLDTQHQPDCLPLLKHKRTLLLPVICSRRTRAIILL